jgi:hypothetical protein
MSGIYAFHDPDASDLYDYKENIHRTWVKVGRGNFGQRLAAYKCFTPDGYMSYTRKTDNQSYIEKTIHNFLQIHGMRKYVKTANNKSQHELYMCDDLYDIETLIDFVTDNYNADYFWDYLTWDNYTNNFTCVNVINTPTCCNSYEEETEKEPKNSRQSKHHNGRFGHNVVSRGNKATFWKNKTKHNKKY